MDRTNGTVANLRKYVEDHPQELIIIKEEVTILAHKLEEGTLTLIEVSNYFKTWKRPHGHVVYEIFANAYRNATTGGETNDLPSNS